MKFYNVRHNTGGRELTYATAAEVAQHVLCNDSPAYALRGGPGGWELYAATLFGSTMVSTSLMSAADTEDAAWAEIGEKFLTSLWCPERDWVVEDAVHMSDLDGLRRILDEGNTGVVTNAHDCVIATFGDDQDIGELMQRYPTDNVIPYLRDNVNEAQHARDHLAAGGSRLALM